MSREENEERKIKRSLHAFVCVPLYQRPSTVSSPYVYAARITGFGKIQEKEKVRESRKWLNQRVS